MYRGLNRIFFGLLFILVDFKIGWFDVLPDAVGAVIIFTGLIFIYKESKDKNYISAMIFTGLIFIVAILGYFYPFDILDKITTTGVLVTCVIQLLCMATINWIYQGLLLTNKLKNNKELFDKTEKLKKHFLLVMLIAVAFLGYSITNGEGSMTTVLGYMIVELYFYVKIAFNLKKIRDLFNK